MSLLRTESFVPLTAVPASGERREFRVTIIPQTGTAPAFQSLANPAARADHPAAAGKCGTPHVSVQREGDRITGIRVQCACGQVMNLACVYEPEAKSA